MHTLQAFSVKHNGNIIQSVHKVRDQLLERKAYCFWGKYFTLKIIKWSTLLFSLREAKLSTPLHGHNSCD